MIIESKELPATEIKFFILENGVEVGRAFIVIARNGLHDFPFALLEDVSVAKGYRKMGIGGSLVDRVTNEARERDCYKLIITVSNPALYKWYEERGFVRWSTVFRLNLKP